MVSNDGPMLGESMAYPLYEKVSETEHRFTITKDTLKRLIDMGMEDDMSVVFNPNYCVITGEDTLHYFPKVTLTYDAGNDNGGDNGNGETPEKPENPDLMLATALTVVLGTAPVTAFAADVDSTVTEAEQTTPQADTTVKEEVAEPEVKAITVDVTTSSTTFDGTQDIVITYTVNGVQDGFEPYQDIPWFDGHPQDVIEENVSDTVYKFTITKAAQQACIERNSATDGQIFVFDSKYSTGSVDFPTVTLTYTTGDNGGDNGNSNTNNQTTAKPTTTSPKTGDATATLPVAGTGLASLGVALATVLRKRK